MTNEFKNGVERFSVWAVDPEKFTVKFPEGIARCGSCPLAYSDSLGRPRCRLTNEIIEPPIYYPELPDFCPLIPTGEIIKPRKGD